MPNYHPHQAVRLVGEKLVHMDSVLVRACQNAHVTRVWLNTLVKTDEDTEYTELDAFISFEG